MTTPTVTAEARRAALRAERDAIERNQYVEYLRLAEIRAALDELQEEGLDG